MCYLYLETVAIVLHTKRINGSKADHNEAVESSD